MLRTIAMYLAQQATLTMLNFRPGFLAGQALDRYALGRVKCSNQLVLPLCGGHSNSAICEPCVGMLARWQYGSSVERSISFAERCSVWHPCAFASGSKWCPALFWMHHFSSGGQDTGDTAKPQALSLLCCAQDEHVEAWSYLHMGRQDGKFSYGSVSCVRHSSCAVLRMRTVHIPKAYPPQALE